MGEMNVLLRTELFEGIELRTFLETGQQVVSCFFAVKKDDQGQEATIHDVIMSVNAGSY